MIPHIYFDQPPPRDWAQFEELCADTFQEEWQDGALVRNGRSGQAQHGVDIVGRMGAVWPVGLQCKKKSVWPVKTVSTADLDAEVEKAKYFKPPLKAFYLISTAPDDQPLSEHARLITERHEKQGLFPVVVIGWGELVRRATRHRSVATKHFGAYSDGPATPLLTTWRASEGHLLLEERELDVAIKELIHELREYPSGRIAFRQKESEQLLFEIKELRAKGNLTLDEREAIVLLRDKLKRLTDRENEVVAGLRLLFGHKDLREYVRHVWHKHAALLVRSFVEQGVDLTRGTVTGLEKIRIHSPGRIVDTGIAIFLPGQEIRQIWEHQRELKAKHPRLSTDNVSELPKDVQFGRVIPEILRQTVNKVEEGVPLAELEQAKWLDTSAWKVTTS